MYEEVIRKIRERIPEEGQCIIAIDGRCASGKTTFATILQKEIGGNLFHMDEFFLRSEQRTKTRLATPGENADHERFLEEVLLPWQKQVPFTYRKFSHKVMGPDEEQKVIPERIAIVEGSYSFHKDLSPYYTVKVFFTVTPEIQEERILLRNGEAKRQIFREKWIPMEEMYFSTCEVEKKADITVNTSDLF